ncbi:hypothetical protein F-E9_242 [Faustovirus]|nr:hypothetical protein F-E9_242 [Faustovirus]
MSFLHEIINNTDEYILTLGAIKRNNHGSDDYKHILYIYDLSNKKVDVYYFPGSYSGNTSLHPDLKYSSYNEYRRQSDALWLLRQETHSKSPVSQLLTIFLNIEELKKETLFQNGKVISNQSGIFHRFKSIYINKGNCKLTIIGCPYGSYHGEEYYFDIKLYHATNGDLRTRMCDRIYIDVTTPHNIAKKMQKIWRKISSPEHDLVDVMHM